MYSAKVYKIMFGAPSDIKEELNVFTDMVYGWNNLHSDNRKVVLMPLHWSINSYPKTGDEAQKILNKEVVEKSDLLICVFGAKLGTETTTHKSGTVEEIDEHLKAGKGVMIFFKKNININPDDFDMAQLEKLREFKKDIQSKCLYREFNDCSDFQNVLFETLQLYINDNWCIGNNVFITKDNLTQKEQKKSIELSAFDEERLRAWTSTDNPGFYQLHFEGGGCIYGLGAKNQYEIKTGKEKVEWEDFFECMQKYGFIDIDKYDKNGYPIYRLKKAAYDYIEKLM